MRPTPLNRITPQAGPHAYKTYGIAAPLATHWRPATCEEVGCEQYRGGWQVRIEGLDPQDIHLATHSGRKWSRVQVAEGETYLVFEPGQPCFRSAAHRVRLDRQERFLVTGGDWRGNPRQERREHASAANWQEDFAEHQDRIKTVIERG